MKTDWNYSKLARAYLKRPSYSEEALDEMLDLCGISNGARICDVGAGTAHLTLPLAQRGFRIIAVEPNDAMRELGQERTQTFANVTWYEGTGEETSQDTDSFDLVTFGSSFNVTDRQLTLKETARILKPRGWFACMWNHRDLDDPLQRKIESVIKKEVPGYAYGARREDQTAVIAKSGLFGNVRRIERSVLHEQSVTDVTQAWRSHATLQRQAGERFDAVVEHIAQVLEGLGREALEIPYFTRIWLAQVRS